MASLSSLSSKPPMTFACSLCDFTVDYHYKGRKPPFTRCILLLEDCFVMKDPFSTIGGFIAIGGMCTVCAKKVCMSNTCSLFYSKRFCLKCAIEQIIEFPEELRKEILQKQKQRDSAG